MSRYLQADHWGHIFEGSREVFTRFVADTETRRLVDGDVKVDQKWRRLTDDQLADLEDSVFNANEDAIANPQDWDLDPIDDLPEWVEPRTVAPRP